MIIVHLLSGDIDIKRECPTLGEIELVERMDCLSAQEAVRLRLGTVHLPQPLYTLRAPRVATGIQEGIDRVLET